MSLTAVKSLMASRGTFKFVKGNEFLDFYYLVATEENSFNPKKYKFEVCKKSERIYALTKFYDPTVKNIVKVTQDLKKELGPPDEITPSYNESLQNMFIVWNKRNGTPTFLVGLAQFSDLESELKVTMGSGKDCE